MHPNVERVLTAARELGLDIEARAFDDSTRTAADAAAAIGVELGQIVKSLVFAVDDQPVVALLSGDNMLDEGRLVAAAGGRSSARMDAKAVRAATGYPVGGVPPFGYPTALPVFADVDLLRYDEVWAGAGTPHVNFRVHPKALVEAVDATVCELRSEPSPA